MIFCTNTTINNKLETDFILKNPKSENLDVCTDKNVGGIPQQTQL